MNNLKNNNIKFCILSSSSIKPLDTALKSIKLYKYFKIKGRDKNVFSVEEIGWETKKDLYILAKNKLYKNYEIFAIEDSLNGMLSAIKSNIQHVIIYKNKYNQKNIKKYYNLEIFKNNLMIKNFNDQKLKIIFKINKTKSIKL